jgi:predicted RNase H-related nuclease YkuK (DUF458 family)
MSWRERNWHSAAGVSIPSDDVAERIQSKLSTGSRIFIGCDSNVIGTTCTYAIAIALYNDNIRSGGTYFFSRQRVQIPIQTPLRTRLMEEANLAIMLGLDLQADFPDAKIEIHLDVSPHKSNLSNVMADQLAGYARAAGFDCKIKPHSWAASGVADEHTR